MQIAADEFEGELFSVWCYFPSGEYECIAERVSAEAAVEKAHSHTRPKRPGVALGAIAMVRITDGDDYCVFEWQNGQGVTFPPELKGRV